MKISTKQALNLEIKLNQSNFAKLWGKLGDLLFEWRLNPLYYKIKSPLSYKVSKKQLEWIENNIIEDLVEFKCYEILED
jgi:hypothetical protein